jgi:RNA polymerase sigma-70 factor (ECF subfamily)
MDKTRFNQLMTHLRPKLYRFALAFTKRTDEADDVVQEIGVKLWERRDELDALDNVEAYAMRSVRNRCLDYARSVHIQTEELIEAYDTAHEQTPYKSLEQADMAAFVRKLIDRLPEQQQMTIRLRDIEGYELEEIAEILGINDGAVRVNLSRARQKIREELLKQ